MWNNGFLRKICGVCVFVHRGVTGSASVYTSLHVVRGQWNRLSLIFLRSAGIAAGQKPYSRCRWQAKLIPRQQPRQHNHFSTAFISYNSRPFVVECRKALVRRPLSPSQVYHSSVALVKHIASQSAQTLTAVAWLYIRKWDWCTTWKPNNGRLCAFFFFFFFFSETYPGHTVAFDSISIRPYINMFILFLSALLHL